jgi:predicted GNAT superfamily acetyltransferase
MVYCMVWLFDPLFKLNKKYEYLLIFIAKTYVDGWYFHFLLSKQDLIEYAFN